MKHLRLAAIAALLSVALPHSTLAAETLAVASSTPAAAPALSRAHAAALREIFAILEVPALMRAGIRAANLPAGPAKELGEVFMSRISDDDINRRYMPIYGRHLDEPTAVELARIFRTSGARKMLASATARHLGKPQPPLHFTPEERRQLAVDENAPSMRKLKQVQAAINEDLRGDGKVWMSEFIEQLETRTLSNLVKGVLELKNSPPGQPVPEIRPERVGISFMDAMVEVVLRSCRRWRIANLTLQSELDKSGIEQVLEARNLVSREGIARSRASLDRSEAVVEQFLAEVNEGLRDREEGMRRIDFPAKERFLASMHVPLGRIYNYFVKFGESQRHMLDAYRRILALAESRLGQLEDKDGVLLFASDADLKLYRAMLDEVVQAQKEQEAAGDTVEQAERSTLQRHGVSPDTGAALRGK